MLKTLSSISLTNREKLGVIVIIIIIIIIIIIFIILDR